MEVIGLVVDTPGSRRGVVAPAHFTYDKTAAIVWWRLLSIYQAPPDGQESGSRVNRKLATALASILSCSCGMPARFWEQAAQTIASGETTPVGDVR